MSHTIRSFETLEEYRACGDLQEDTWGRGFSERVPVAILKVSQILSGVAAGAFDDSGRLDGFVFGMTGLRDGTLVHWSDMLAVRPDVQDTGLGTRLKAFQRERVMALGIERMNWTFDPLQAKNAYVNFNKLGIVVREYVEDMYGDTDSPLHRGIGTDRFVALWLMSTDRVAARLGGKGPVPSDDVEGAEHVLAARERGELPAPTSPDLGCDADHLLVSIPSDILTIMERSVELAVEWRHATRSTFACYLRSGYEVAELIRGDQVSDYLLRRIPEESE